MEYTYTSLSNKLQKLSLEALLSIEEDVNLICNSGTHIVLKKDLNAFLNSMSKNTLIGLVSNSQIFQAKNMGWKVYFYEYQFQTNTIYVASDYVGSLNYYKRTISEGIVYLIFHDKNEGVIKSVKKYIKGLEIKK